ncbi:hypothetical protein [Methylobacterium sp. J-077]|uniref:hypothetical protein n=1 Tax=Methylobacterium sp. J-077 TaxID=2836656 RepID=UPI001FBB2E4C|nr:hypothetical protein [Methylobacterium sp. J-077]MCJ2121633.1 hypothetical protein [Methylobacterium sp. J-077]
MNIIYGGHLDRSFLMGGKLDRFRVTPSRSRSPHANTFDPYRSFFHHAGMMSALSAALVRRPDRAPPGEKIVSHRGNDGRIYDSILRAELEDDALRLAHLVVLAKAFSDATLEMMRLRGPEDPHEPNPVHHVEDILWAILDAWQTQSTLILADCDRQVLVELLNCVIQNGIALPFGIPDLRKVRPSDARTSGSIANLEPGDYDDLIAMLEEPAIQTYRQRLSRLSESRTVNVGTLLKSALAEAQRSSLRIREAATDITLTSTWVTAVDTVDLDTVAVDPFRWTDRKPSKPRMHIIVLSSSRSLS